MSIRIAFSGLDGSGKSTQIEAIRKRFEARGFRVKVQQHFDTEIGGLCENIIKLTKNPYVRALTFALDEYSQQENSMTTPDYDLILCDRSCYCAIAYSGAQGVSQDWIMSLYKHLQTYDLCIYLDVSLETSYLHKEVDYKSPNINKTQFCKVKEIYLDLVRINKMIRINAEQEFDRVTDDIENIILKELSECH